MAICPPPTSTLVAALPSIAIHHRRPGGGLRLRLAGKLDYYYVDDPSNSFSGHYVRPVSDGLSGRRLASGEPFRRGPAPTWLGTTTTTTTNLPNLGTSTTAHLVPAMPWRACFMGTVTTIATWLPVVRDEGTSNKHRTLLKFNSGSPQISSWPPLPCVCVSRTPESKPPDVAAQSDTTALVAWAWQLTAHQALAGRNQSPSRILHGVPSAPAQTGPRLQLIILALPPSRAPNSIFPPSSEASNEVGAQSRHSPGPPALRIDALAFLFLGPSPSRSTMPRVVPSWLFILHQTPQEQPL
ncbi:hypothetical protein CMUS01_09376 [Colletotrichum musicola]|uniref:Uncharacterized protein n=1 Tax=Colletotrichum musicola TaxID=2175873 RepID=A0A8H6K811_9PEZI|nr:hypothetical protein CMUS01_09376 [Colletotrichum musicola]